MRKFSLLDHIIVEIDTALKTLRPATPRQGTRDNPATAIADCHLDKAQTKHVAGLMRVNHAGEVCAQALYQGQAMTAQLAQIREQMEEAAHEEIDHLSWCEVRLTELNSKPSILNPLWYTGSLMIGAVAGLAGDRWSLGFVAETEKQVTAHLATHLRHLPEKDAKSRAILTKMQEDEIEHAQLALRAGGKELPFVIRQAMRFASRLMTKTSYHI